MSRCLLLLLLIPAWLGGQADTSAGRWVQRIDWQAQFWAMYQQPTKGSEEVLHPLALQLRRGHGASSSFGRDHPLLHGAAYVGLYARLPLDSIFDLKVGLIGEHRGFSSGLFNTNAIRSFPLFQGHLRDSFRLAGQDFYFTGRAGYFEEARAGAGLVFFNLPAFGLDYAIHWRRWRFQYIQYNDFLEWIGLNYDEPRMFWLSRAETPQLEWGAGARLEALQFRDWSPSFWLRWRASESLGLYAQYELRPDAAARGHHWQSRSGALLGGSWEGQRGRLQHRQRLELRYYGSGFNQGWQRPHHYFRDVFYALLLFDRPYSQWPVFTEFQGRHTGALSWQANLDYRLHQRWRIWLESDLNLLGVQGEQPFVQYLYTAGIGLRLNEEVDLSFIITNKGMNEHVFFPAFYQYRYPFFGYRVSRRLPQRWW
jgi:hypothetical protein